MKRDYQAACRSAVNGLYSSAKEDMEAALWEILEALDPELASLMADDEEAARTRVNHDSERVNSTDRDEEEAEEDFSSFDDEGSED